MDAGASRREFMAAVGALSVFGQVETPGPDWDPCEEVERLEAEVEQLEAGTSEEGLEATYEQIQEIMRLHAESRPGTLDRATKERALEVGLATRESVAYLEDVTEFGGGSYTAWFVEPNWLLTNAHNIKETVSDSVGVTLNGDSFDFEVVGVQEDRSPDVALLHTDYDGTPLATGDSASLSAGDALVLVGHPGGFGNWTITAGPYHETIDDRGAQVHETDIPALSGSSGSPVVDLDGAAVGMLFATRSDGSESDASGNPVPADPEVYTQLLPIGGTAQLVAIEEALRKMEGWR